MSKLRIRPSLFAMLLGMAPLGVIATAAADPPARDRKPAAGRETLLQDLLEAHNRERAQFHLTRLEANRLLERAALVHARDMAEHDWMSHTGTDGSTPKQRIDRQEYPAQRSGENIAAGQTRITEVMRAWMKSPEHKENILGDYTEMGAACARDQKGHLYWCVDFGRPWPHYQPEQAAHELLEVLNRERSRAEKPPLRLDSRLTAAARHHAQDMARQERIGAKDDDGLTSFERARQAGYRFQRMSEEAAAGQPTPQTLVASWLDRPSSREKVLGDYSEAGVGYARGSNGTPYWSLLIGEPMKSVPDRSSSSSAR